jgi:CIC family chloride channel protein
VVAGLGAVLFLRALGWSTRFFLGTLVGYLPPFPVGEGSPVLHHMDRPWLLPIVTGLGGLVSGVIIYSLAPEAEGHGTDAAIEAIHHKRGLLRARVPPIKLIASAITIGTGGSGGREGPAAQISAGFGSILAQWLKLSVQDRRILVAAGMGAGIGAIFRAPLGGALMAAEILYLHDLEVEALIPGLIASIVGYSVFGAIDGFEPIFGAQPELGFTHPWTLAYFAGLGIVAGLGGLLYARTFYGIGGLFHRLRVPRWVKPAIGGVLVGIMGIWIKGALHTGYGWIQISMSHELLTLPLWIVIALPFAKILATALSISSGGSGGIFGPGMVIGGMFGATYWRLFHGIFPQMSQNPAPYVIIGMMALFGGIAHAPLAVMLMVAEMTGNLSLLAPAMVAVALSTALVGDNTIYVAQLPTRADSPAHRVRFSFPLLSSLFVSDAMRVGPAPPGAAASAGAIVEASQPLDDAMQQMAEAEATTADVVDSGQIVGRLTYRDALTAYKAMLQRGIRRVRALPEQTTILEARLTAGSRLAGKTLRERKLPHDVLVVSILRQGEVLVPRAETVLQPGDIVTLVASPASLPELRQWFDVADALKPVTRGEPSPRP